MNRNAKRSEPQPPLPVKTNLRFRIINSRVPTVASPNSTEKIGRLTTPRGYSIQQGGNLERRAGQSGINFRRGFSVGARQAYRWAAYPGDT